MFKTRAFLADAITFTAVFSPFMAPTWADDAEKAATAGSKTNGDTTPPTEGVSKESRTLSAVENELSQLREELNAEHVAIDAQQERIAELEAQLRILRTASSTPESGTTAGNAAVPVFSQPAISTSVPSPHQSGASAESQNRSPL